MLSIYTNIQNKECFVLVIAQSCTHFPIWQFGEADGAFYGTKLKTLRRIAQTGKTCLLDCSPSAVSRIRTAEFMPFVVFLAAPSCNCMKAMYEYGRSMGFTEAWKRVRFINVF